MLFLVHYFGQSKKIIPIIVTSIIPYDILIPQSSI